MKKASVHTLGCKLNYAETSTIAKQLREEGFELVDMSAQSDLFVLNTCSVTERADRECRQIIRRVRRQSPNAYVVVMGCYAQLQPDAIASIEGVDLVLGTNEKFNLFGFTDANRKEPVPRIHVSSVAGAETTAMASSSDSSDRTRVFLKIQDGCDYGCAFCTIPLARGASRSVPIADILAQAARAARDGNKEVVLTGVNVGDYGKKLGQSLLKLLEALIGVEGIERIRISSIEPNLLDDHLMDFWLVQPKLCKHFHIPLQSGNDHTLRSMRRRYLRDFYADRVQRIAAHSPGVGIGADVLVGFPGETDELFEQTYRFMRDLPLTYFHVFTYSERPKTPAIEFGKKVEPRIRSERSERLRMLGIRKRRAFHESLIGKTCQVLFESEMDKEGASGLTEQYARVVVKSNSTLVNMILPVRIVEAQNEKCLGILQNQQMYLQHIRGNSSCEVMPAL